MTTAEMKKGGSIYHGVVSLSGASRYTKCPWLTASFLPDLSLLVSLLHASLTALISPVGEINTQEGRPHSK